MTGLPPRNPVYGAAGVVASSHPAVSALGMAQLASGGTALDATLAMAAMSWICLPGQCGVGGDAFAIVREPDGTVWTTGASGFGPDGGDYSYYRDCGLAALPLTGPLAVAAPGAIAALNMLHARGASRSLAELWHPTVEAARRGVPCTAKTRDDVLLHEAALRADHGAREVFFAAGRAPHVGERVRHRDLADSIAALAHDPDLLYTGELGERAVTALAAVGAPFAGPEWTASGQAEVAPAISHQYGRVLVHETPPPTPGWMVLQQAGLLADRLAEHELLAPAAVSLLAAAARQAFADRWAGCGSDNDHWRRVLGPGAIATARHRLPAPTTVLAGIRVDGDTTSTVAVDSAGRAVSFIQSLAFTFGAHISIPGTGILLNNRLARGAYLLADHPNGIRPRRRPLHTLNAWLATEDGELAHVGNTPGGDGQVQWNMQLLSHLVDHHLDPQQAVSAPRLTVLPGSDAHTIGTPPSLRVESRLGQETISVLEAAGENVEVVGPWAGGGSALVVSADRARGTYAAGVDPRQDGVALGV